MSRTDLYIIAAGNGSRINVNVPKALVPIVDEPCLTTTLQQIGRRFGRVFVVTNCLVSDKWQAYFDGLEANYPELAELAVNLPIRSGLGDGHATMCGLLDAERKIGTVAQDVVIAWGDVFFPRAGIFDELLGVSLQGSGLVPAVYKSEPYVSLLVDEKMRCMSADFSKYGEKHSTGFHDQSVFRFDASRLKKTLGDLHCALWKNGRYITPSGELSLLYSFHYLYNSNDPLYVYETSYPTVSFNTVEEVMDIQRAISEQWKVQFRCNDRFVAAPKGVL
jgi:NDP-sugar pyrophosphorylase family protein